MYTYIYIYREAQSKFKKLTDLPKWSSIHVDHYHLSFLGIQKCLRCFRIPDEQKPLWLPFEQSLFYTCDQFPSLSARVTMKTIAFAQKAASPFSSVVVFLTRAFLQVFNVNTQLLFSLSLQTSGFARVVPASLSH